MTSFLGILGHEPRVGKSTTVVNLATMLALSGQRTLVVDGAETPDASRSLGYDGPFAGELDAGASTAVQGRPNLDLLSLGPLDLSPAAVADSAFRSSCSGWEYVIADLPTQEGECPGLIAALDAIIILMVSRRFSLQHLAGCVQAVAEVKGRCNETLRIAGVLITQADRRLREYERTLAAAGQHFPVDVYPFAIPRDEAFAGSAGPPACGLDVAPASRATRGYVELTMEILSYE